MATRTLSSERDRRMTLLLLPFMSCSAKLPIYALLVGAFFPVPYRVPLTAGLYGLGVLCGCLYAALLRRTWFKGEAVPFVMELPTYRLPSLKSVLRLIGDKAQSFLQKAFTLILLASVCIWFLQTFDAHFQRAASPEESLLAALGGMFAPLFTPLGFGDWRVSTALDCWAHRQGKRCFHHDAAARRRRLPAEHAVHALHGAGVSCVYAAVYSLRGGGRHGAAGSSAAPALRCASPCCNAVSRG